MFGHTKVLLHRTARGILHALLLASPTHNLICVAPESKLKLNITEKKNNSMTSSVRIYYEIQNPG